MQQERERLSKAREEAQGRLKAAQEALAALDQEERAIEAYERVKQGTRGGQRAASAPGQPVTAPAMTLGDHALAPYLPFDEAPVDYGMRNGRLGWTMPEEDARSLLRLIEDRIRSEQTPPADKDRLVRLRTMIKDEVGEQD